MARNIIQQRINSMKIRVREKMNPYFAKSRQKRLEHTDFSIISNNCWGGHVYRYYGLPYSSPTIGLYIWADDYLKMLRNLKSYFSSELKFIKPEESKHFDFLVKRGETNVPIALLDDVEIVFLHYISQEEVLEKWKRRVSKVNYKNLVVKFSDQNCCSDKLLQEFDYLKYKKKVVFTRTQRSDIKCSCYYKGYENEDAVSNDTVYFRKYLDIEALINEGRVR